MSACTTASSSTGATTISDATSTFFDLLSRDEQAVISLIMRDMKAEKIKVQMVSGFGLRHFRIIVPSASIAMTQNLLNGEET